MADELEHPHDNLFRKIFPDPREADGLLRAALPAWFREGIDWGSLVPREGTFVDEALLRSESDLLFEVAYGKNREPVWLYVLLEHQSTPDRRMPLRLLKYCCRIWDAQTPDRAGKLELRPIVPVVFYQGARRWTYSRQIADLLPAVARKWPWTVRFEHLLLDQTTLRPNEVEGGLKGRLARLVMMAAYKQHGAQAVEMAARLLYKLRADGEMEYFGVMAVYILATQDAGGVEAFEEALRRQGKDRKGGIMPYAQELIEKGRAEGEQLGRLKTVESLLRVGVGWEVIEEETGLNEAAFQALKKRMSVADDR